MEGKQTLRYDNYKCELYLKNKCTICIDYFNGGLIPINGLNQMYTNDNNKIISIWKLNWLDKHRNMWNYVYRIIIFM